MASVDLQSAFAHFKLGLDFRNHEQWEQAAAEFRRGLALRPDDAEALHELGAALYHGGHTEEAIAIFRQLLLLRPDSPLIHFYLGNMLYLTHRFDESIAEFGRCIALTPDDAEAHNGLGNVLRDAGKLPEAVASFRQAVRLRPTFAEGFFNLANTLKMGEDFSGAIEAYRKALALQPNAVGGLINLGNTLKDIGELDEAIACYDAATAAEPNLPSCASNRLYALHFHSDDDAAALFREHRRWNERFARPLAHSILPFSNDRTPGRRLRIGYVSPNLRMHPVGRFLLPLWAHHDHAAMEVFGYNVGAAPDEVMHQLRSHADAWREIRGLPDEKFAELIRNDRIDILVDLSLHMGDHSLLVFARKPAPVQVTYLAYCGTSGLDAMDYRLSDPYLDPPGMDESCYSEKTIRLPRTYWCYESAVAATAVSELPAMKRGFVTFGCLNNYAKNSAAAWEAWRRVLAAVPDARLVINAPAGEHLDQVRRDFASAGIDPTRLNFVGITTPQDYFHRYDQIDIALDPFPYCGGTTTCDALWMGVPVVTLRGATAVGRGGVSILSNVDLPQLIADDVDEYVAIAADLAKDSHLLGELRTTLRARMQASPLMDAAGFARDIESAYREMWRRWCAVAT